MYTSNDFWKTFDQGLMDPRGRLLCVELMELLDEDARLRRRDWWDCAGACCDFVDDFIVVGQTDVARQFARLGEIYANEAIARGSMPLEGRGPHTKEELTSVMYGVLYTCRWFNSGEEDIELLRKYYERCKPGFEGDLKRLPKQHRAMEARTQAMRACWAGDFEAALEFATFVQKSKGFPFSSGPLSYRDPERLFLLVSTYLADPEGHAELRPNVVTAIQRHLEVWRSGDRKKLEGASTTEAIAFSYLGAKYFEELAVPEFTRTAIVRRIRFAE